MKIVATGRGGVGKTSFVALSTKYFIERNKVPILLIDADSDQNLSNLLGIDLEKEKVKTISEVLFDILEKRDVDELRSLAAPIQQRIEYKVLSEAVYEGNEFDLITIGAKFTQGCYCLPNDVLRRVMEIKASNYKITLLDSPAGLEHLNRMITPKIDVIFEIIDQTPKSIQHTMKSYRICNEIGIQFKNFYLIGNHRFENFEQIKEINIKYLGKIEYDKNLEDHVLKNKSILDLPNDSISFKSVSKILDKLD